jgi:hypothetical protein
MSDFPAATAHGPIEQLFPDLFWVRGSLVAEARGITIARNMIILRTAGELTLINAVRLDQAGEAALAELGEVAHLVKLGAFHGLDDPYYVDRYRPTMWAPPGSTHKRGLSHDRDLTEEASPPGTRVFAFRHTERPEAALIVPAGGGTLITCDAVTNIVDTDGCAGVDRIYTAENGLLRRASIGAAWRRAMTPEHGPSLLFDFKRLLDEPFVNLISAHGPPLLDTARDDLAETLRYLYRARV